MASCSAISALLLGLTMAGFGCVASSTSAPDAAERIRRVETGLLTYRVAPQEPPLAVEERLQFYRTPAVSVAVIDGGRIAWAKAWGEVEAGGAPAGPETLFQAASISKPVAAAGALRLVEEGVLELDLDVNSTLRSWKVPENGFTEKEKVTLRRLLSHSAGTTVHGFPGYAPGAPTPSLVQLLDGAPPANTAAVLVDAIPGSAWRYSGGGTSVVQLLMSDATGRPFADLMRDLMLAPLGMSRSTFEQPLPAERLSEAATGHGIDGAPIPGRHRTHPEQAAAGLWTTPSDLARFAIAVASAFNGNSNDAISAAIARKMLTRNAGHYGLGFALHGEDDDMWFEHGGANAGFRATMAIHAKSGSGAVLMTNGDAGVDLAREILRAIAREYGFPRFRPEVREAVKLDPEALRAFVGDYFPAGAADPTRPFLRIRLQDGALFADAPFAGWIGRTLRADSEDSFYFVENPGEIEFVRDDSAQVVEAVFAGFGEPMRLARRFPAPQ